MIKRANVVRRTTTWIAGLCAAWVCISAEATAADAESTFLRNPSFEVVSPGKAPSKGNELGRWVLKGDLLAPTEWTLSSAYPGELEVIEGDAADGQRCLRVAAGPKRAAHLAQRCPALRRGLGYEVSLRYRGGPIATESQ